MKRYRLLGYCLAVALVLIPVVSHGKGKGVVDDLIKGVVKGIGVEVGKEITSEIIDAVVGDALARHPSHPNVIQSGKEGSWKPVPGYVWREPGSPSDLSVKWSPGSEHPDFEHVVASDTEGKWVPEDGYTWTSTSSSDLSVKYVCSSDITTISRLNNIDLGGEIVTVHSPVGFNEITKLDPEIAEIFSEIRGKLDIKQLTLYLPDSDIGKLLTCDEPDFGRQIFLGTLISNFGKSFKINELKKVKTAIRSLGTKNVDKLYEMNKKNIEKIDMSDVWEVNQVVPLGVYLDEENVICTSYLVKMHDSEEDSSFIENTSTCVVSIKNRLLYVSAIAIFETSDSLDFDWSRRQSESFMRAIVADNY